MSQTEKLTIDTKQLHEITKLAARYGLTVNECLHKLLKRALLDVRLAEIYSL